jgi:hypothetical protein
MNEKEAKYATSPPSLCKKLESLALSQRFEVVSMVNVDKFWAQRSCGSVDPR